MTDAIPSVTQHSSVANTEESPLVFWSLIGFLFIVFVAPQAIFPFLNVLHLAKVSAVVALGVYIVRQVIRSKAIFPRGPEVTLLTVFIGIAILSIPFSLWPGGSLGLLVNFYSKSLAAGLLVAQTIASLSRFKELLQYLMVFLVIDCVIGLRGFETGEVVEGYRLAGAWSGITSNPNDLALTLNIILPYGLAFWTFSRHKIHTAAYTAFIVIAISTILVTYSRGGFITLVVVVMAFPIMIAPSRKKGLYFVLASIGLCAILFFAPEGFGDRVLSSVGLAKDHSGSATSRRILMEKSMEVILEHPLLGVGIGMNILALNDKGVFWQGVHNVYLEIASEMGIVAMILFIVLMVRLYRSLPSVKFPWASTQISEISEIKALAVASRVSLLAYAVAAMFHPVAYHIYFYLIAGLAIAFRGIVFRMVDDAEWDEGLAEPTTGQ